MTLNNPKDMVKFLKDNGFSTSRINSSHHILKKNDIIVSVPIHTNNYSLGKNFIHNILKKAGLK